MHGWFGLEWVWGGEERMGCQAVVEYIREAEDFKVRINGNAEFKNIIKKYRIVLLVRI